MTGTASGSVRSYLDFDTHRNQEWLRRRKMRLEQVRQQSNKIARVIRQKVIEDEKARLDEYERKSEANIRDWKAERLAELGWLMKSAIAEFGESYRRAEEESELEEIIKEKNKINSAKAQKRGEIAKQEELKKRKMAEEKKLYPIQRKQLARKKENLRSALVCSVPFKKQLIDTEEDCKICKTNPEQQMTTAPHICMKKIKQKKTGSHKSCLCKHKSSLENFPSKESSTVWINLNEIQTCETSDSSSHHKVSKSSSGKNQKEKPEGTVEFYDFSSRYHSKSFKEFPHLVERIDSEPEVPNATELAEIEEMKEKEAAKKKMDADALTQERGMEALRKEKILRSYNSLIPKLEELSKKEKILKSQHRNAPMFFYMNDERLSERNKNKQRMMDAKFEKIYYEATAFIPQLEPLQNIHGGGDYIRFDNEHSARLSFSPSNLKPNTPVTSQEKSQSSSSEEISRRRKKTKKKQQLLLDIDRALREGRELRKTAPRSWESSGFEGEEETDNKKSSSDSEASVPPQKEEKEMKCQESQTDDIKEVERDERVEFDKGEESLPVSSSTSYKSPPSVIRSCRLREFLASLDEGHDEKCQNSTKEKKIDKLVCDLIEKHGLNELEKNQEKPHINPTLEYYIEKLLTLSREYIANLSVSSDYVSTPNITDWDGKEEKTCQAESSSQVDDLVRKSTLDRANQVEETIKNWKKILGKNSEKVVTNLENLPRLRPTSEETAGSKSPTEPLPVTSCTDVKNKYEEITKKCSERISELKEMLDKVRRDKEKLLSSTSGGSSLSLNKDERTSEKESVGDEEEEEPQLQKLKDSFNQQKSSPTLENFINRYNLTKPREETVSTTAVADSQSFAGPEESLDSWPDVMDELIKKEIITSPFKWSDGEYSSEFTKITDNYTKPTSIETVIGNFREEIKKIKPFSLSDSYPQCNSQTLRQSFDEGEFFPDRKNGFLDLPQWSATESGAGFQEESSVESINHALTSLGLNWAKSFLRKNEESKAMSSSSNSEGKSSEDEDDFN